MYEDLEKWTYAQRQIFRDEIGELQEGAKYIGVGGQDVTAARIKSMESRLRLTNEMLDHLEWQKRQAQPEG